MLKRHSLPALLMVLLPVSAGFLGCAAPRDSKVRDIIAQVQQGRYEAAVSDARRLHEERPNDATIERLLRDSEIALLLDRGRALSFAGNFHDCLEVLNRALDLDPSNNVTRGWMAKTMLELSDKHLDRAQSLTDPADLREAALEYELALARVPTGVTGPRVDRINLQAGLGLVRVLHIQQYNETLSASQFADGLRNFRDFLFARAKHSFDVAVERDNKNDRAIARASEVGSVMATEELSKAFGLEEAGFFHAARNQFRMVLLIDPTNQTAIEGLDRNDLESRANDSLAEAQMKIIRGEFDQAEVLIDEAEELSEQQEDSVGLATADLEDARLKDLYTNAVELERDYRYEDAVVAFDELLAEAGFYEDAVARRDTVRDLIVLAKECYAQALAAEDDKTALSYLRQIPVFWPEYKDVSERVIEIEKRLGDGF